MLMNWLGKTRYFVYLLIYFLLSLGLFPSTSIVHLHVHLLSCLYSHPLYLYKYMDKSRVCSPVLSIQFIFFLLLLTISSLFCFTNILQYPLPTTSVSLLLLPLFFQAISSLVASFLLSGYSLIDALYLKLSIGRFLPSAE